jgi:hypothetical protein
MADRIVTLAELTDATGLTAEQLGLPHDHAAPIVLFANGFVQTIVAGISIVPGRHVGSTLDDQALIKLDADVITLAQARELFIAEVEPFDFFKATGFRPDMLGLPDDHAALIKVWRDGHAETTVGTGAEAHVVIPGSHEGTKLNADDQARLHSRTAILAARRRL